VTTWRPIFSRVPGSVNHGNKKVGPDVLYKQTRLANESRAARRLPSCSAALFQPNLPEWARQTGEAMLLLDTLDRRALLYIEQNGGATLSVFDGTDPGHIKSEGSVHLDLGAPFGFFINWTD